MQFFPVLQQQFSIVDGVWQNDVEFFWSKSVEKSLNVDKTDEIVLNF